MRAMCFGSRSIGTMPRQTMMPVNCGWSCAEEPLADARVHAVGADQDVAPRFTAFELSVTLQSNPG